MSTATLKLIKRLVYGCVALAMFWFGGSTDGVAQIKTEQNQNRRDDILFNRDIRPILSNHCFACHGPDKSAREAGLRLDLDDDVDFDEVVEKITADDESEIMPPKHFNKPLNADQIRLLKKWIQQGAKYESHWAFTPPTKSRIPADVHPVDYFVDAQLSSRGLSRSARAKPEILIRRLYLDLNGLPPPVDVADKFMANPTREAYESLVDRLLASPQYGERWARRWLDLARYSDTNGFEKDRDRSIWPYRDWVIRAINSGKPFDQFTIEQLAGDMLPNATQDQMIATGFHRNTMLNEEGGIDPLEYRYYSLVDRVATTGTTWLGLTLSCAQCHSHKYDPISHKEYFSMMAYFNNADEPDYFLKTDAELARRAKDKRQAQALLSNLGKLWPKQSKQYRGPDLESAFKKWLQRESKNITAWKTMIPTSMSTNAPHLSLERDGVIFARGDTTKHDTYKLVFPPSQSEITAIRLEVLPDSRLPGGGPGMTFYEGRKGDFFLAEIKLQPQGTKPLQWSRSSETYAKNQFGNHRVAAELATDGKFQSGWSVAGQQGFRNVAVFNLKQPLPAGKPFTLTMEFGRHFASSLGKFRLSATNARREVQASVLTDQDLKLLKDSKKASENKVLRERFLMQAPQVKKHADKIRHLLRTNSGVSTLIMRERTYGKKRRNFLYHRGEFIQPKDEVAVNLPESLVVSKQQKIPTNRLEFARWIVSRDNPLTARVVANRQWAAFFGTGLVATLDDFGMQGNHPTHARLLDYLAVEFMDQNWSIKKLHRLIVTSQTYQQSSNVNTKRADARRMLAYFPRRRLEAEIIRDTALAASGLLDSTMYGPPVRPPQPKGAAANFQKSRWQASTGRDRFRRSVYTYQKRTAPFAMYTTFDATSGESCIAKRNTSNTPLQALTLMNDPMFLEISEALGKRMSKATGKTPQKIEAGFRWVLTRKPSTDELQMLTRFYQKHQNWTALARVLLCLDETITKN